MPVVATAGHVDHGKSTLVRALTGTDPDRWAEERRRGLTIDLGFASMPCEGRPAISFVDVPGHERFVKNMLAGAGAIDLCLFVVAATEGWKAQSEEHLRILDLLGFRAGVVAVTRVAGLGAEAMAEVRAVLRARLAGTFLAGAATVGVDAPAGVGVDELRAELEAMVAGALPSLDRDRPRLWVDRAFAVAGAGTVVTGTLGGGSLRVGDHLETTPDRARVRVRALQSHGRSVAAAGPGVRLAVNVTGVDARSVERGAALVRPGQWEPTCVFDAAVTALRRGPGITRRGAWRVHIGAAAHPGQVRVLGTADIGPGAQGWVRVRLPVPVPILPGDRFVLREDGRGVTVGGGEILDVAPVLPASRARPDRSVDRVIAERGWIDAELLRRLTGETRVPTVGAEVASPAALAALRHGLVERARAAGPAGVDAAVLDGRERAFAARFPELRVTGGRVTAADTVPDPVTDGYLGRLRASPFAPPPPLGVDRAALRRLRELGLAAEWAGVWFAVDAVEEAAGVVAELLAEHRDGVAVAAVRDRLGTSRKFTLALLGLLDDRGVTRRRGDLRVPGPRLPGADRLRSPAPPAGR